MARPIKETPILRGKCAQAFKKQLKADENKKISKEKKEEMVSNFNFLAAMAQF